MLIPISRAGAALYTENKRKTNSKVVYIILVKNALDVRLFRHVSLSRIARRLIISDNLMGGEQHHEILFVTFQISNLK